MAHLREYAFLDINIYTFTRVTKSKMYTEPQYAIGFGSSVASYPFETSADRMYKARMAVIALLLIHKTAVNKSKLK